MDFPGLHINDPSLINLRKAARTVLLAPTIFFVADLGFDQPYLGVFGFLSCFVALVFANFGGPVRSRALAYLATIIVTNIALAAGSLLADTVVPAALAMAIMMFAVTFAGVYGGYAPAFVAPMALAYAFAVFIPLETIGLTDRLIGWSLGGIVATLGAILMWPVNARTQMRTALAEAASGLADALSSRDKPNAGSNDMKRATKALAAAHKLAASPLRPAGVARHDVGLLHLLESLGHAVDLANDLRAATPVPEDDPLAAQVVAAFRRTASVLRGESPPDGIASAIEALDQGRLARRRLMVDGIGAIASNPDTADLAGALAGSFALLALSHVALWIEVDAAETVGAGSQVHAVASAPELASEAGASSSAFLRIRKIARAEIDPDGVVLRNSVRAAIAMGLGVLVAKLAPFDHGFWVVLGVLSVLRSSAASTSSTALRAVAGTFVGFVVAAIAVLLVQGSTVALWWLLPPMVFLAAYAPGAIGFAVGQAGFTGFVVFLFNILNPEGFTTDLVRLETVTLGAVTAALVALVLWPRGARAALARSVATVYRTAAASLGPGLGEPEAGREQGSVQLEAAIQRSNSAFVVALGEHGEHIDADAWSALSRPPAVTHALLCGLLSPIPDPPPVECEGAIAAVRNHARAIAANFTTIADQLETAESSGTLTLAPDIAAELNDCLRACAASGKVRIEEALIVLAWSSWLWRLDRSLQDAGPASAAVAGAASDTAWLRWSLGAGRAAIRRRSA